MYTSPLPEYDNPPVVEVALSVEFLPLAGWRSPYAGRYWESLGLEYPTTEEMPPLPSSIETFNNEATAPQLPTPRIQFAEPISSRFWFISESGSELIQVQRDRFTTNWRKVTGEETYPRYDRSIRPRFIKEFARFQSFVTSAGLGSIEPQQCEVTYVNNIVRGEAWDTFADLSRLFSFWSGRGSSGFLPEPESLNFSGSFLMPEKRGRLRFSVQHAISSTDMREIVQVQITARGRPASTTDEDVWAWLDFGRDWIVRGFTDLTTPKAHSIWALRK
jgi:uncharacterized protein (TIGR04255 family)